MAIEKIKILGAVLELLIANSANLAHFWGKWAQKWPPGFLFFQLPWLPIIHLR
jgi:hypothetical protein